MNIRTLFIALTLVVISGAAALAQESREVKKTVDLARDGEVYIDTYKGSITISSWDKPQVAIEAKIEPDGRSRHNERKVRDTEIRIDDSPRELRIVTDYDRIKSHSWDFFGLFDGEDGSLPFVHYTITMPRTAHLRIKDYKSDSRIEGLESKIVLETYKGTVSIRDASGPLDLETYKGDVTVGCAKLSGDARVETYKGSVEFTLPRSAAFTLDADIGRRADLDSDFNLTVNRRHRGEETYRTEVNGGGPVLRISTDKGKIRLRAG